jgi:hypothetical protein
MNWEHSDSAMTSVEFESPPSQVNNSNSDYDHNLKPDATHTTHSSCSTPLRPQLHLHRRNHRPPHWKRLQELLLLTSFTNFPPPIHSLPTVLENIHVCRCYVGVDETGSSWSSGADNRATASDTQSQNPITHVHGQHVVYLLLSAG